MISEINHQEFIGKINTGEIYLQDFPSYIRTFFTSPKKDALDEIGKFYRQERWHITVLWLLRSVTFYLGLFLSIIMAFGFKNLLLGFSIAFIFWFVFQISFESGAKPSDRLDGDDDESFGIVIGRLKTIMAIAIAIAARTRYPQFFGTGSFIHILFLPVLIPLPYLFGRWAYKYARWHMVNLSINKKEIFYFLIKKGVFKQIVDGGVSLGEESPYRR
ncbi:MAG: hypothetical protein K9L30_11820 [Desulfobacterales bacterium]|nr:hypothetical protein [Desulfobacterales bacterium]